MESTSIRSIDDVAVFTLPEAQLTAKKHKTSAFDAKRAKIFFLLSYSDINRVETIHNFFPEWINLQKPHYYRLHLNNSKLQWNVFVILFFYFKVTLEKSSFPRVRRIITAVELRVRLADKTHLETIIKAFPRIRMSCPVFCATSPGRRANKQAASASLLLAKSCRFEKPFDPKVTRWSLFHHSGQAQLYSYHTKIFLCTTEWTWIVNWLRWTCF